MIRIPLFAGLFFATSLSGLQTVNAGLAEETHVADVLSAIVLTPGWLATANAFRSDDDKVVIEGLSIDGFDRKFHAVAELIEISGLAKRGRGYISKRVWVRNLQIKYSMSSINLRDPVSTKVEFTATIQRMEIADLYLPAGFGYGPEPIGALAPLVNVYTYLANVELTSLSTPLMIDEQALLPGETKPFPGNNPYDFSENARRVYHDISITNWSDGIIALYEHGSSEVKITSAVLGAATASFDNGVSKNIDLARRSDKYNNLTERSTKKIDMWDFGKILQCGLIVPTDLCRFPRDPPRMRN